jgi:hypothetical protein
MASILNATTTAGVAVSGDNSGVLALQTNNGTTAVTIDTNQRAAFVAGTAALPAITTTGDTNTGIFFSAADTIDFAEGGTACGQFDSSANFKFNSGYGSVATAYGCRAWVNFNGTGTVAIRASGNVSSITDNGTGEYTINFTTALADADYATISTMGSRNGTWSYGQTAISGAKNTGDYIGSYSTTAVSIVTTQNTIGSDRDVICVSVFR